MDLVEELFGSQEEAAPPEVQRWEFFLQRGIQPTCTFVRRRDGLTWSPPLIVISYPDAQPPVAPDAPIPWDTSLDRWLIDHRVAAIDEANEAQRFGFGLQARFEPIERRCGSGYFNALLVEYLRESGLAAQEPVADKLSSIHEYRPHLSTSSVDAATQVRRVLGTAARDLETLNCGRDKAIEILSKAIAYYLDNRFNISTRKLLGLG